MGTNYLRVTLTPNGFYPQSLFWRGRRVRVLCVEETYTCGLERRYRLRTSEGRYELGLHTGAGTWQMRRAPLWLERLWNRIQAMPRYPAPAGRRRGCHAAQSRLQRELQAAIPRPRWAVLIGR